MIVEGKPLIPPEWFVSTALHPGVSMHPLERGMDELSRNLEAELGFGALQWRLSCAPPEGATLDLSGLRNSSHFVVFVARTRPLALRTARPLTDEPAAGPCGASRSLMLGRPAGVAARGTADTAGRARIALGAPFACGGSWALQVLALRGCELSRVGGDGANDSNSGTLASLLRTKLLLRSTQVPHASDPLRRRRLYPPPPPRPSFARSVPHN